LRFAVCGLRFASGGKELDQETKASTDQGQT
jgi:hypothetical protein